MIKTANWTKPKRRKQQLTLNYIYCFIFYYTHTHIRLDHSECVDSVWAAVKLRINHFGLLVVE
ncbi:hypothetical protein Hanom_Chr09g00858511 [Helianthus anomalus]